MAVTGEQMVRERRADEGGRFPASEDELLA
jgi:hypothetical protein